MEQTYKVAVKEIQPRIEALQKQINQAKENYQKQYEELGADGISSEDSKVLSESRKAMNDNIRLAEAKLGVYKNALKADKVQATKDFYSGQLDADVNYQEQLERARIDRREARTVRKESRIAAVQKEITWLTKGEAQRYIAAGGTAGLKMVAEPGVYTASGQFYPTFTKENKWLPSEAVLQKGATPGERIVYTTEGGVTKPVAIESTFFGQTIPIEKYNAKIEAYNKSISIPQVSSNINPNTGRPYGVVSIAPNFGQRYSQEIASRKENLPKGFKGLAYVGGTLDFLGSEVKRGYERTFENIYRSNPQYASLYMNDEPVKTLIGAGPSIIAYSSPAGPLLGTLTGAEVVLRKDTNIPQKLFGVAVTGLSLYGVGSQIRNIKLASDIKNAKTIFFSQEKPISDSASSIQTISKTQVGKKSYYGFTKQGVIDYSNPLVGDVRVGSSRGLVIADNKKVYPIDIITNRVQPYKDVFISKSAGEAARIKNLGNIKVGVEQGEGVLSVTRIRTAQGDYVKSATAGGFKPIQDQEGFFSFYGGNKPLINKAGTKIIAKTNIRGVVQQTSKEGNLFFSQEGGITTLQKGKTILKPSTQQMIAETVAAQRATALDIAKQGIKETTVFGLGGLGSSVGLKQEVKTIPIIKQEIKQQQTLAPVSVVKTETRVTPTTSNLLRTEQVTRLKQGIESIQDLNLASRQMIELKTQQAVKQRSRQTTQQITPTITTPTTRFPPIVPPFGFSKAKAKILLDKLGKRKLFDIFVRRRKKDVKIGQATTEAGASKVLKSYLKRTLAASGYVAEGKTKVSPEVLGLDYEFGRSKRDAYRVIQKRGYRLGTRSEVSEIMGFKKKKRNKKIGWF